MSGEMLLRVYARGQRGRARVVAESKSSVSAEALKDQDDPRSAVRELLRVMLRRAEADLIAPPPELSESERGNPEAVQARAGALAFQEGVYEKIVEELSREEPEKLSSSLEETGACAHVIADARNEKVVAGYICLKCGAVFEAADHDPGKFADRDAELTRALRTVFRLENDPQMGGALGSFLRSVRGLLSELKKRQAAERRSSGPAGEGGS